MNEDITYLVYVHEEIESLLSTTWRHWLVGTFDTYEDGEACCQAMEACGIPSISIEMVEAEHVAAHPEQYGIER